MKTRSLNEKQRNENDLPRKLDNLTTVLQYQTENLCGRETSGLFSAKLLNDKFGFDR